MTHYVQVVDDDGDEPMELPSEPTGELLQSTLVAQFPGACGLKYKPTETGVFRGLRLSEGKLLEPDEGWGTFVFLTVYPKVSESLKRKGELANGPSMKLSKVEKHKCSDLIVLGLPWKSTEEDIRTHFAIYGELSMVQLKYDAKTKQSKGFGFIRFTEYESQVKALSNKHMIDGRWCNVRVPNSKIQDWNYNELTPTPSNKIYVGRLSEDLTNEDIEEYFGQYGEVREVFIPKPFRAFAFVTFVDPHVAQSLYGDDHIIKNNSVHIGTATPKSAEKFGEGGYGANDWSQNNKAWMKAGGMQAQMDPNMMPPGLSGANGQFGLNQNIIAAAAQAAITQGILGMMGQNGYPSEPNGKAYPSSSKQEASHSYPYSSYQSSGYPGASQGNTWGDSYS